jgi:AcrR family transcriptional regulator
MPDRLPAQSHVPVDRSTRGRILSAAERLFAEDGFAGVSMPAIAKASGITAGAIYKHFDSKDDLFFEVVSQVSRTMQAIPLPENRSDATSLPEIVATYTSPRLKLLRLLSVETHYASARHPRVRRLLRRALDHNIAQISEAIVAARDAGKLAFAGDPKLLAGCVMIVILGLMHMETLLPDKIGDAAWHDFVRDRVRVLLEIA